MILPSHPPVDRSDSRRGTSSKASSDGASNEPPTAKSERATSPRSPFGANGLRALQRARSQRPRMRRA